MAAAVASTPHFEPEQVASSHSVPVEGPGTKTSTEQVPGAPVTPPATEGSSKGHGSNASDLSDLDLEDDEEDEIVPDHYYDGGKIPVFRPSMSQFKSFKKFIEKINHYGMRSGIVKVIPPPEWTNSLPALDEAVKNIKIKNPIFQDFSGGSGTWTQANIEKQRSYNLPQWKALTEESQNQPPAKRGERRKNQAPVRSTPSQKAAKEAAAAADGRRRPGRPRRSNLNHVDSADQDQDDVSMQGDAPPTPTSPDMDCQPPSKKRGSGRPTDSASRAKGGAKKSSSGGGGGAKSVAERRKYNIATTDNNVDEAAFEDFDYRYEDVDQFTQERCAELETAYWRSLMYGTPMYGGDMPGSLFEDTTSSWNVAKLENILDVLGQKVPGVNTTYLYLGMWKATFAWHLEDVDLYSINYIHFGAPKQWYSISQADARKFEQAMKSVWTEDAKNCSQFLRHKTYLISPDYLEKKGVKVNKLVHREGEFVITFPYGYHSGYNLGYNCAESVNFATEEWLEYGRIAKKCDCEADSVWIDVAEIERKLRGEPTPEYEEEVTDDDDEDLDSLADHTPMSASGTRAKPKGGPKKRKRGEKDMGKKKVKKIKIRINTFQPCVLCPNNNPSEPLLPIDNGRKAHRCCAHYTPETRIVERDGRDTVANVAKIDRQRLDLKCNFCRSKAGACFQCSSKKCTRAFHATCAAAAGVQVDYGPSAVYGPDGTEYFTEEYDFRCKFHRARRPKNTTSEGLEASGYIRKHAQAKTTGDVVQIQHLGGEVFAGTVVENRPSERTLIIDILPEGDRLEVEWRYVLALDPADSQRRKPSPDAKPLPDHMSEQISLDGNAEFGPPQEGDDFTDATSSNKWAEFSMAPTFRNREQVQINLSKPNMLWYYLPKISTETKPQYTEDLAKPRHNRMSDMENKQAPRNMTTNQPFQKRPSQSYPNGTNFHALNAISRQGPVYPPNQQYRHGKAFVPHSSFQRQPSGFPGNPYVQAPQRQTMQHGMYPPQRPFPHTPTPSQGNQMSRQWTQAAAAANSRSPNPGSPSNNRAPTPSPLGSPATMRPPAYRGDEAHRARLAKYPYIQRIRQHQEETYPYGYTSPFPGEDEISKPYMDFLAKSEMQLPSMQPRHPQAIYPFGAPCAPMAAMGGGASTMRNQPVTHETDDQFAFEMAKEAERLNRQMSRGASLPSGPE